MRGLRRSRTSTTPFGGRRVGATICLMAVAGASLVATACGGGELSRAEYERKLEETGREVQTALDDVGAQLAGVRAGTRSVGMVVDEAEAARARLEREADELEAVDPPDDAEAAHALLVVGVRELARDLGEIEDARDRGDVPRLQELASGFHSLDSVETIRQATSELESEGYDVRPGS